ncbi:MAG: uncharacterized protein QOH61_1871 [Chloroflexota bacterium]|nr:uncharacterized protein [Chloroflexota bacterium]
MVLIVGTLVLAPAGERPIIALATMVAVAAGLASTAIGVYGGVLVPGLLLLGIDPVFAAALSLFLQVIVIPIGASTHYRMGNFSRRVALPLVLGGMIGSFVGPFVAAWVLSGGALDKQGLSRVVAATIVGVGVLVLATLRLSGLGAVRAETDVPRARVAGIGVVAGLASGISGAGWGPIGVKLLILTRIDPRQAIGSSLFARVFMAASAVVAYFISATAFKTLQPDWWLVVPIFAGSIAPMIPGAYLVSRLGRERATVGITLLSIGLAIPTLIWGH